MHILKNYNSSVHSMLWRDIILTSFKIKYFNSHRVKYKLFKQKKTWFLTDFDFCYSMDRLSSRRNVHAVSRYGQCLHNENQHVRGYSSYGKPNGVGKRSDHSGRRMRGILHAPRKHYFTREYLLTFVLLSFCM